MAERDPMREAIAGRLRMAREQAGLSQGQVAKLLKVHRPAISEIEAGRRRVSAEEIAELSRIYDVSADWLTSSAVDPNKDEVQLAARQLAKLKRQDLDTVLKLLQTLRRLTDDDRPK
jgi:transcriptional regulator with XRE-family HTH domain